MEIKQFYNHLDVDTHNKYITEVIEKTKKRWLKSDKEKMKQLKEEEKKLENQSNLLTEKLNKIYSKIEKVDKKIDKLNKKYSYKKKIRIKNENYIEPKYAPI